MCMMLAARYRSIPVAFGAIFAFVLLNTLAVVLGAASKELLEPQWISIIVAVLFLGFGIHTLLDSEEDEEELNQSISAKRLFMTTFMLIAIAEFGDKTQLAVVALCSSDIPLSIFIGATLALTTTTILGVWAGFRVLNKIPMALVQKVSGLFFIGLGILASVKTFSLLTI